MLLRPNLFLVGGPKCGTTSLYEYLRVHPQVYMPYSKENFWQAKEPYFFCQELIARPGMAITDEVKYLQLYAGASPEQVKGDCTALNLFSKQAAERIFSFNPASRIIIMLREPVSMMRSWHGDCLRYGHDEVVDFKQAVALEPSRKLGLKLPRGSGYPACLQYREMARFSVQVKRFLEIFPREQVHFLLLDDLASQPLESYQQVLRFLQIDPTFVPEFRVHNEQISLTNSLLYVNKLKNHLRRFAWLTRMWKRLPRSSGFAQLPFKLPNAFSASRRAPDGESDFNIVLRREMAGDVAQLSQLIDRDLSGWLRTD